eukprot:1183528-Prorocentrum_minimum.AAC.2
MLRQAASRLSNSLLKGHALSGSRGYAAGANPGPYLKSKCPGAQADVFCAACAKRVLVITAMGADKKGKLTAVTDRVAAAGGNLESTKIARMNDEIAMILHVSITEAKSAGLVGVLTKEEQLQPPSGLQLLQALIT